MIRIVLPDGHHLRTGMGTKVYTHDGHEILGIESLTLTVRADQIISARMEVSVQEVYNLEDIAAFSDIVTVDGVQYRDELRRQTNRNIELEDAVIDASKKLRKYGASIVHDVANALMKIAKGKK